MLNSRYQLLEEMGQGGMGAVFRAHDRLLDQPVAIKQVTVPAIVLSDRATASSASSSAG